MEDYVLKLQEDLRKRLDRLSWMHNEPTLQVVERFTELRAQVDYDAERLLAEIQSSKTPKDSNVNETRLEFIRILDEIEKRTGHQPKPDADSSEVYASLEHSVETFKDSSSSLDDLEDLYLQLAREIISETEKLAKRLLGDQTIVYCSHEDESKFGSLVYFGDIFLDRQETGYFFDLELIINNIFPAPRSTRDLFLVRASEPYEMNQKTQVVKMLVHNNDFYKFRQASKFFYVGKSKEEYSGYSAEGSSVEKEFVSYQCDDEMDTWTKSFLTPEGVLKIESVRLESLDPELLPKSVTRLVELTLRTVHFESIDTQLLAVFTNLTKLNMQATFSKGVVFDLGFLGALRKLEYLELTLPNSPMDLSVLMSLAELKSLKLKGSSHFYAEKLPRLSKAVLEQIVSAPRLESLELSCFDIETIDGKMPSRCEFLDPVKLPRNHFSCVNHDCIPNLGFAPSFVKLWHNDRLSFNATSFARMVNLRELSLTGNSITNLPLGVFQDLTSLERLNLDKNRIRHISAGVFDSLDKMTCLTINGNPIEAIESNIFAQLYNLRILSLNGCQLKSIDSKMFNGLKCLKELHLSANLIDRIEVVADDGRRINVAKADLNDEEKELVKEHLFRDLISLKSLFLGKNKLEKLDLNCFRNLKRLEHLSLSSNKINELNRKARSNLLWNLRNLMLNDNQLTNIDKEALPKTLTHLNLSKNKLKRLDEDFFAEFKYLYELDLSQNELTMQITEATFVRCKSSLKIVNVKENESIRFTEQAFVDMQFLKRVKCDFNEHLAANVPISSTLRIRGLAPEVVREIQYRSDISGNFLKNLIVFCKNDCSNLEWKSMQETPEMDDFNSSWLAKASTLGELNFSGNFIETLDDPKLFADLKSISKINLSGNRLSCIHRDIFKCLPLLKTIDLSGNSLSSIDTGLFRHLTRLRNLNLSSNNLSFLSLSRLFRACPFLKSLDLADNQLDERSTAESIDARTSYFMEKLVMANNRFEKMDFVRDMTSLKHLDLRGNRIKAVMSDNGENLIGRLFNLTHLDLSRNKISPLTDEMFTHLHGQLEHLDVSENLNASQTQQRSQRAHLIYSF